MDRLMIEQQLVPSIAPSSLCQRRTSAVHAFHGLSRILLRCCSVHLVHLFDLPFLSCALVKIHSSNRIFHWAVCLSHYLDVFVELLPHQILQFPRTTDFLVVFFGNCPHEGSVLRCIPDITTRMLKAHYIQIIIQCMSNQNLSL